MLRGGVSVDNEHADILLASVQSLRTDNLAFDFFIHVNDTVFPVHKLVLISFSDYFRAMLLNDNFEETKQGKVEMKNLEAFAMKEAIEYMYTGNCSVSMENLSAVLSCADILQLEKLKEISFKYMMSALSDENCVFFLHITATHSNKSIVEQIGKYFRSNFFAVGSSDDFMELEYADVSKYIHEYGLKDIEAWKVGLTWIKHEASIRAEQIFEIVRLLRLVDFPSPELLKCMWEETIFTECSECVDLIRRRIFHDVDDLKQNLNMDNCIFLKRQARRYMLDSIIQTAITDFMKTCLGDVMTTSDFSTLHRDDIEILMIAHDTLYLSETMKWNAINKWMEVNLSDSEIFPKLFQSINFYRIPCGFINDVIDNSILKESGCYKEILEKMCKSKKPDADSVALLLGSHLNKLFIMNLSKNVVKQITLPVSFDPEDTHLVSVSGRLCFITSSKMYFLDNDLAKFHSMPDLGKPQHWKVTKAVVLNDCIYILGKNTTLVYTPVSNQWLRKPGCGYEKFNATSSTNFLYVLEWSTGNMKRFDPTSFQWTIFCNVPKKDLSHILFVAGGLYVTNGCDWMQYSTVDGFWHENDTMDDEYSPLCQNYTVISNAVLFVSCSQQNIEVYTTDVNGNSFSRSFSIRPTPTAIKSPTLSRPAPQISTFSFGGCQPAPTLLFGSVSNELNRIVSTCAFRSSIVNCSLSSHIEEHKWI